MSLSVIIAKLKRLLDYVKNLDYSNPRIILTILAFLILPFIAKYLVLTGLVIGVILATSVLWTVEKSPEWVKRLIHSNPLIADLVLSTLAVAAIGSFLGTGLTLALGFIFLDVILAMTLPLITSLNTKSYGSTSREEAVC